MDRVVVGMDPHKRSATIEVMAADESVLVGGRYGTDRDGWSAPGWQVFDLRSTTNNSPCCGSWSTAAGPSAMTTPG
ncbi:hypothetical protein GCM10009727_42820 [Actinomadura napierensis]|uniref:IS110 family transposase n=1 Tax=Actinomadura napierensis TaxID=267854 RepID=A0ABN2ZKK0_9ACTN